MHADLVVHGQHVPYLRTTLCDATRAGQAARAGQAGTNWLSCRLGLTSQSNATASPHIAACMRSTASDGISSPSPNEGVKGSKLLALCNTLDAGLFGNAQIPHFGRMQPPGCQQ